MATNRKADRISVFEVGPRDGLQSEKVFFDKNLRRQLIEGLILAGLPDIEVGSFVKEDRIPQLAKTGELLQDLRAKYPKNVKIKKRPHFWAFVPNERGLEDAIKYQVDGVSLFCSVSDTFAKKNVNQSSAELLLQAKDLIQKARAAKLRHRVYVSTIHFCPYEGIVSDSALLKVVSALAKAGCDEIVLSDTTGHSTPGRIAKSLEKILKIVPAKKLSLHLHDTRGLALANICCAIEKGISRFDSSFGGLGGCPYAPGAAGNLATEDLIYLLNQEKISKDKISLEKIAEVSAIAEVRLARPLTSKVYQAIRGEHDAK